jgi:hypothetical protein
MYRLGYPHRFFDDHDRMAQKMKIRKIEGGTLFDSKPGWALQLGGLTLTIVDDALTLHGSLWYLSIAKRDTVEKIRRFSIDPNVPPFFWALGYGIYFYQWQDPDA